MPQAAGTTMEATMPRRSSEMERCIDECTNCHEVCLATAQYCLQQGGKHAEPNHIRLLADCAQICQTSADFMLRGSALHNLTCDACMTVCEECARDCEKLGGDKMMQQCADSCRSCADSCRQMSAH